MADQLAKRDETQPTKDRTAGSTFRNPNAGGASAADLEELGEMVRKKVYADSGITLEWEIKRVGEKATSDA